MTIEPEEWHRRATAAADAQDTALAKALIKQGIAEYPGHADLLNSAGNIHLAMAEKEEAAGFFALAASAAPRRIALTINHAIALGKIDRHGAALKVLAAVEDAGNSDPTYCSARASAERSCGNLTAAGHWYDRCLLQSPAHQRARHGRARVALERAELDAVARFDHALSGNQGDAELWLGKAQALDVAGRTDEAIEIMRALVDQAPQWLAGLQFMAQLRLGRGDVNFTSHYADAAIKFPGDPNISSAHIAHLAGMDRFEEAVAVAHAARLKFSDVDQFALAEAIHAGAAGDDDRAEALFTQHAPQTPERDLHEARHRIRRGEWDRADALLDRVLEEIYWDGGAWALRGIVWRETAPDRAHWLHGQDGLTAPLQLLAGDELLSETVNLLQKLHNGSPLPLGQSLRGGTQTRGLLFARTEPVLARLQGAIMATIEEYRAGLPPFDPAHPLLRHRDTAWTIKGSWSVRLHGGGDYHTAHIHPQGLLSSALYLVTPNLSDYDEKPGWLELGRPPQDLRLDWDALSIIEPMPGRLALFPSTLYHGTRPFPSAQRMTVAFDVIPAGDDFQ